MGETQEIAAAISATPWLDSVVEPAVIAPPKVRHCLDVMLRYVGLGRYLTTRPWLIAGITAEIECVTDWLRECLWEQTPCCGDPDGEMSPPCGTDFLAYLPFNPTSQTWPDYYVKAWDYHDRLAVLPVPAGRDGDPDVESLDDLQPPLLRYSPWLRFQSTESPQFESPEPPSTDPAGGRDLEPSGVPALGRENRAAGDDPLGSRPELSCERLRQMLRNPATHSRYGTRGVTWRENTVVKGGSGANRNRRDGRGALLDDGGPSLDNRPLFVVLCSYFRSYWEALLRTSVAEADASSTRGVYPFGCGSADATAGHAALLRSGSSLAA